MMGEPRLSREMISFFENKRDPKMIFVATAGSDGKPNVAAKGLFVKLLGDDELVYADIYSKKTLQNLTENPVAAVAAVNVRDFTGYQFKGPVEILTEGPLFDEAAGSHFPKLDSVTRMKIREVYIMDYGPDAGKRIV